MSDGCETPSVESGEKQRETDDGYRRSNLSTLEWFQYDETPLMINEIYETAGVYWLYNISCC